MKSVAAAFQQAILEITPVLWNAEQNLKLFPNFSKLKASSLQDKLLLYVCETWDVKRFVNEYVGQMYRMEDEIGRKVHREEREEEIPLGETNNIM